MQISNIVKSSLGQKTKTKSIFVLMSSHKFWEGLFNTVDIGFIKYILQQQLIDHSDILMTLIVPKQASNINYLKLLEKEENLREFVDTYGSNIKFIHIQGRSIGGLISASKEIDQTIMNYQHRLIWAKNYFNCFIAVLIKRKHPETRLHFEMSGLVPEEELYYSDSNLLIRIVKFLVLKIMEGIDLNHSDSISVVSKKFKELMVSKHRLDTQKIDVIPCFFDGKQFYRSSELRNKFRNKIGISNNQKLVLYSGMLQKYQEPELLFEFIKNIQNQDSQNIFRFILLTYDQERAHQYAKQFGIKDLIIESASNEELTGFYNGADIGLAFRSADPVSFISSPVKIPEYLATGNSLITLEHIGDFGMELKNKRYVLIKKDRIELLKTQLEELINLEKPDSTDLEEIREKYSLQSTFEVKRRIINY